MVNNKQPSFSLLPAPYCELHCHSNYSLLDGTDSPETLVARAAELGLPALALTDHDAVYGAVELAEAARQYGLQPIFGAELTLAGGHHLTLLVENETGWSNLCRLISRGRRDAPKGEAALPPGMLANHTAGLIALSGCWRGELAAALLRGDAESALAAGRCYREWFGPDNFWIELQHHLLPDDDRLVAQLVALAIVFKKKNLKLQANQSVRQLQCLKSGSTCPSGS